MFLFNAVEVKTALFYFCCTVINCRPFSLLFLGMVSALPHLFVWSHLQWPWHGVWNIWVFFYGYSFVIAISRSKSRLPLKEAQLYFYSSVSV